MKTEKLTVGTIERWRGAMHREWPSENGFDQEIDALCDMALESLKLPTPATSDEGEKP